MFLFCILYFLCGNLFIIVILNLFLVVLEKGQNALITFDQGNGKYVNLFEQVGLDLKYQSLA